MKFLPIVTLAVWSLLISISPGHGGGYSTKIGRVDQKLHLIILPEVRIEQQSMASAIESLREMSRKYDRMESDESRRGVRIGFDVGSRAEPPKLIDLRMEDVSLAEVLREVAMQANRQLQVFSDGVVLRDVVDKVPVKGLVTRIYRVPADLLDIHDGSAGSVDDPFGLGGAEESQPTGKKRTVQELFEEVGIPFPEGTSVRFNRFRNVIVVVQLERHHELIEAYLSDYYITGIRNDVRLRLEVYSVESRLALQLEDANLAGVGGRSQLKTVRLAMDQGKAELTAHQSVLTRSGQRTKSEAGYELAVVKGYLFDGSQARPDMESKFVGRRMEVDPVIGADGRIIETNIAFSITRGEPVVTRRKMLSPVGGKTVEFEHVELESLTMTAAIVSESSQPAFLGVVQSDGGKPNVYAVFLTATIGDSGSVLLPE